jgi:hypothetical protein
VPGEQVASRLRCPPRRGRGAGGLGIARQQNRFVRLTAAGAPTQVSPRRSRASWTVSQAADLLSARRHACRSSLMPWCAALAPWVCTPWHPRRHFAHLVLAAVQGDEPLRHQLRRASAGVAEMVGGWLMVNLEEHGVDCDGTCRVHRYACSRILATIWIRTTTLLRYPTTDPPDRPSNNWIT